MRPLYLIPAMRWQFSRFSFTVETVSSFFVRLMAERIVRVLDLGVLRWKAGVFRVRVWGEEEGIERREVSILRERERDELEEGKESGGWGNNEQVIYHLILFPYKGIFGM